MTPGPRPPRPPCPAPSVPSRPRTSHAQRQQAPSLRGRASGCGEVLPAVPDSLAGSGWRVPCHCCLKPERWLLTGTLSTVGSLRSLRWSFQTRFQNLPHAGYCSLHNWLRVQDCKHVPVGRHCGPCWTRRQVTVTVTTLCACLQKRHSVSLPQSTSRQQSSGGKTKAEAARSQFKIANTYTRAREQARSAPDSGVSHAADRHRQT